MDEDEVRKPEELAPVEPRGAAGDQGSLHDGAFDRRAFCAHQVALHPGRERPGNRATDAAAAKPGRD
jgi:hypothetical protein